MFKIRRIKFNNHPILKDLELNFCDSNGNAIDTIILAGENGTGKSTILNELYNIASHRVKTPMEVEYENDDNEIFKFTYFLQTVGGNEGIWIKDSKGKEYLEGHYKFRDDYAFNGIFSDVDINFNANSLSSVTSLKLDASNTSHKSTNDLPTEINQLLIDVQALDDAEIAKKVKENPNIPYKDIDIDERMSRFTNAFNKMFENLSYSHVENIDSHKSIVFQKYGIPVPIKDLSSGEKQIIYRGSFLLKDKNAMNGAFVFIDEPEISLHPDWQLKIMNFYKGIFTNDDGLQTSQIFAVTHSPFIIHNDNRINDKVIVLERNDVGDIIVKDKPEYFKCDSIEAVKDAFSINFFNPSESMVYLEGRTDEKYFSRALEVFDIKAPFKFKWIGYIDANGQESNTGSSNLDKAFQFLVSEKLSYKNICLYDCDTNKQDKNINNVFIRCIPKYVNSKNIKKGIENALILDEVDMSSFYEKKQKEGDYGEITTISEFKKMEFCDYICTLDNKRLIKIMGNLKLVIDSLLSIF